MTDRCCMKLMTKEVIVISMNRSFNGLGNLLHHWQSFLILGNAHSNMWRVVNPFLILLSAPFPKEKQPPLVPLGHPVLTPAFCQSKWGLGRSLSPQQDINLLLVSWPERLVEPECWYMVGFSPSTATADTAATEQFIQLMAIKQSWTEKDKTGRNRAEMTSTTLKILAFFQICELKFSSYNQKLKVHSFNHCKKPVRLAIRPQARSWTCTFLISESHSGYAPKLND